MAVDMEAAGDTEADVNVSLMLEPGLKPVEVAEQYFLSCTQRDTRLFLATLHLDLRGKATSKEPGPYHTCNWELGRTRVEKYRVHYKLVREASKGAQDQEALMALEYTPLYGPVPGYPENEALGPVVILTLKQQGGPHGEWRVAQGEF